MSLNHFANCIATRAKSGDFEALKYFPFLISSKRLGIVEARECLKNFLYNTRERLRAEKKRSSQIPSQDLCPYEHQINDITNIFKEMRALKYESQRFKGMTVNYRGIEIRVF